MAAVALGLWGLLSGCGPASRVDYGGLLFGGRDGWQYPARVVRLLAIEEGDTLAEIGAGDGYWLRRLAREVGPSGRVYAVESDPARLEKLRDLKQSRRLEEVEVIEAPLDDPKLPQGEIDLVLTSLRYRDLENRPEYFRRLRRVLSPEGRIAHLENRPDAGRLLGAVGAARQGVDAEQVAREMAEAGYERVAAHDFLPTQSFQIFAPIREPAGQGQGQGDGVGEDRAAPGPAVSERSGEAAAPEQPAAE